MKDKAEKFKVKSRILDVNPDFSLGIKADENKC